MPPRLWPRAAEIFAAGSANDQTQADRLATALANSGPARIEAYLDLAAALRARVADIDYVDLRFDDRIYVRPTAKAGKTAAPARASASARPPEPRTWPGAFYMFRDCGRLLTKANHPMLFE